MLFPEIIYTTNLSGTGSLQRVYCIHHFYFIFILFYFSELLADSKYVGCYIDTTDRDLPEKPLWNVNDLTLEKCLIRCRQDVGLVKYSLGSGSPSCYIVSLINIDNWPCLRIDNFQQMTQTRSRCNLPRCMILSALQIVIDQSEKYVSEM